MLRAPDISLKWPNDLVVAGDKVGGILSESDGDAVVVGLGVNLYWPDSPVGVTALFDVDPGPSVVEPFAAAFAEALFRRLGAPPEDWGRDEYLACSVTVGQRVRWEPSGEGRAVAIGPNGELVVETATGSISISSGEVWHVRAVDG